MKKHQKEKKVLKAKQSEIMRSKLYRRVRKLKVVHNEDLQQKQTLKKQLRDTTKEISTLKKEKVSLQKRNHELKKRVQKLKREVDKLEDDKHQFEIAAYQRADSDSQKLETRKMEHNEFTESVRKTMIQLQGEADVAACKCRQAVQIVGKQLFGQTLSDADLPCVQTVLNMADEGHFMSKLQIAEIVLESKDVTLHTDGTARDHNKIVGQQISLPSGATLSLGFVGVDTENSSTLLELTIDLLDELSEIYCLHSEEEEKETIFKGVLEKVTSVMSDRASVMKSYNEKLLQYKKTELGEDAGIHFLYCNAHFLLGLSKACEAALKTTEREISQTGLGRDALSRFSHFKSSNENATSRPVRTASDCLGPRGDEKSGCRAEWQGYCDSIQKRSEMTSYRSNRFNCYFEGAAATIFHQEDIIAFLQDGVSHLNLKVQSVEADLQDQRLVTLLSAVARLYFRVTGPYWKLLKSDVPYTRFHIYVQKMATLFARWQTDPSGILNPAFVGIFDGEFEVDCPIMLERVLSSACHETPLVLVCFKAIFCMP